MYNLQKAKEEIDLVAKHTGVLTEHVIAVGERLQALEGTFAAKLDELKTLIGSMEKRFGELESTFVGGEAHQFQTSAISDLGAKVAQLHPVPPAEPPLVAPHGDTLQDHGTVHHDDHGHAEEHGHHSY